jgi:hypothetical protein
VIRRIFPMLAMALALIFLVSTIISGDWVSRITAGGVLVVGGIMVYSQVRAAKYRQGPAPEEDMIDAFDVPPETLGERLFPVIFIGVTAAIVLAATLAFLYALWQWW